MAKLLHAGQHVVNLNSQQLAVFLAPINALSKKDEAFRNVLHEMQTFKEEAERLEEKSKYLELDVSRTDAYLSRTRKKLAEEQRKNVELTTEVDQFRQERKVCHVCREAMKNEAKSTEAKSSSKSFTRETKEIARNGGEMKQTKVVVVQPESSGIPYDQHEVLTQQVMDLKQELRKLAQKNGQDEEKVLDAVEYKRIIKGLQQDIQDKADENERLLEKMQQLCSQDVPVSKMVQLQFKNEKLQKRLDISQVMIDTLSKRCEELKDEVEMSQAKKQDENDDEASRDIEQKENDFTFSTSVTKDEFAAPGKDAVDGGLSFEQLEKRQERYEKEIQLLDAQLKQVLVDNKQLVMNNKEAERQRAIFEERYNELMETLRKDQEKKRQCSNCRSLEQKLAKLSCEVVDLKDINELIKAQMKSYEEDLRQEQMDTASLKLKHSFHIEQWKKNCQRMGQQVDLLMDDLRKEREVNKKLKQKQEKPHRAAMSLAPTFSNKRCTPRAPKSTPWQVGYQEVEIDGPGHDEPDGIDMPDSLPGKSEASLLSSGIARSLLLNQKPHECPRCKREYAADQIDEYQRHVNRCIDSS